MNMSMKTTTPKTAAPARKTVLVSAAEPGGQILKWRPNAVSF